MWKYIKAPNKPRNWRDAWEVLDRQQLFSAPPWLTLSRQKVRVHDGRIIEDYYQLELPDFVVVVATTPSGQFVTLRQYKHGVRRTTLTMPGGMVERGEEPLQAAQREFVEETGYFASNWRHLASYTVHGNLGAGVGHYFSATMAKPVAVPQSGDLEEMEILLLDRDELIASVWGGKVALLNHAAAISLAILSEAMLTADMPSVDG